MNARNRLRILASELTALERIMALMQWDQEVVMPVRAADDRADQFSVLSGIHHQKLIAPELGEVVAELSRAGDLDDPERALLRVVGRERDRAMRLPEEFVREFSALTSRSLGVWVDARKRSDFSHFAPFLEKIVLMSREKAAYLGFANEPYDALLDLHEEGLKAGELAGLFAEIGPVLSALLESRAGGRGAQVEPAMNESEQVAFAEMALAHIGYDFSRGRQDRAAHPFSTTISHHDRRVTNRYNPNSLEFIFSALHEGGHALYEQGIAAAHANTPLDDGVSLGIHESQSRLWENIIGRSHFFWEYFYPELQKKFPAQFSGVALDDFLRSVNRVQPGLIRVEADEVSYNLHVQIRFELERELMNGSIGVNELPALWKEKYARYLGVTVPDDRSGVLQDIHWSHGSIGYFPTYTIGNLAAAQFWNSYCCADPDWRQTISTSNLARIREWLTENVYCHGAIYPPAELLARVTGERLTSRYFLEYLERKYGRGNS